MVNLHITDSGHNFEKSNLVTISGRNGLYDEYKCSDCGLKGKRYGISSYITVKKATACKKVKVLKNDVNDFVPKRIRIRRVTSPGFGLENLSEHTTCPCPKKYIEKYQNDTWVISPKMNEAVRLFYDEFEVITV